MVYRYVEYVSAPALRAPLAREVSLARHRTAQNFYSDAGMAIIGDDLRPFFPAAHTISQETYLILSLPLLCSALRPSAFSQCFFFFRVFFFRVFFFSVFL